MPVCIVACMFVCAQADTHAALDPCYVVAAAPAVHQPLAVVAALEEVHQVLAAVRAAVLAAVDQPLAVRRCEQRC